MSQLLALSHWSWRVSANGDSGSPGAAGAAHTVIPMHFAPILERRAAIPPHERAMSSKCGDRKIAVGVLFATVSKQPPAKARQGHAHQHKHHARPEGPAQRLV